MSGEVIKEFLVALGFKVDEAGLKKFNVGISKATGFALSFGAAVTAMAGVVVTGVAQVSRKFEDLYYLSQRVGASANNITSLGYAFSQLGGDANQAKAAVGALADFMKLLPGGESVIQGMGVATRNASGEARDTVEVLMDLAKRWRGMDLAQANVEAGMLGIDTATLRVLTRDTDRFFADYQKRLKETGADQDAAAAASARLMQGFREAWAVVVLNADALLLQLQPALQATADTIIGLYDRFQKWNHGSSESRREVGELGVALGELWVALSDLAKLIWQYIGPAITEFAKGSLKTLRLGIEALTSLIQTLTALLRGDWKTAWTEAGETASSVADAIVSRWNAATKSVRRFWYAVTHKGASMPEEGGGSGAGGAGAPAPSSGSAGTTAISTPMKQAFDYFKSVGWTDAQAAGIVANLKKESNFRADAVGDGGKAYGIAQWHPDRQAAFRRWAGKDIRQSTYAEQLAFVNYELTQGAEIERRAGRRLRGATSARDAGGIVSKYYERPLRTEAEMLERGNLAEQLFNSGALRSTSPSVSLNQTTTINVDGTRDPQSTGREIAQQQSQVNAQMVRNARVAAS